MGAMHGAGMAWAHFDGLSIGGSEGSILDLMAHMRGGTILDILWADEAMNTLGFVVIIILLGVGALTLHSYDVRRVLIWRAFGRFVLGAVLLGYRGEHL
jgi:hypothetical protein